MTKVVGISEYLRTKMVSLAATKSCLTHPEVIELSQRLDTYIVEEQKSMMRNAGEYPERPNPLSEGWLTQGNRGTTVGVAAFTNSGNWDSSRITRFDPRPY